MSSQRRPYLAFALLGVALFAVPSFVGAQVVTGQIIKDAPLLLLPDPKRQPLLIMEAGVLVRVHGRDGNWVNVTVEGSRWGRRTGYVEAHLIRVLPPPEEDPPRVTADSTIAPRGTAAPATSVSANARAAAPLVRTSESFQKSKLATTVEDKTRESDVVVRYDPTALIIIDKKSGTAAKTFPYAEMKSAEYSYAKSPRWKTAILVSPFFLFTSGKKHWFLVQGTGEYALLHLDKSNYRLILAAFEARTGLNVETVADTK